MYGFEFLHNLLKLRMQHIVINALVTFSRLTDLLGTAENGTLR